MLSLSIFKNELLFKPLQICNTLIGIGSAIYYVACINLIINVPFSYHNKFWDEAYIILMLSVLLGHSTACVVFVIGIFKRKRNFIYQWLLSQIIFTIVVATSFAYQSFYVGQEFITMLWSLAQICIWLCGYALYQNTCAREAEYDAIPSIDTTSEKIGSNESKICKPVVLENVLFCIPLGIGNVFFGILQAYFSLMVFFCFIMYSQSYVDLVTVIIIILAFIHFIFCLISVIGIFKEWHNMLLLWLCSHLVVTTITTLVINRLYNGVVLSVLWITFQTYIWLCGYSYYHRKHSKSDTISNTSEESDLFPNLDVPKTVLFCIPLRIGNIIFGLMGSVIYIGLGISLLIEIISRRSENCNHVTSGYRNYDNYYRDSGYRIYNNYSRNSDYVTSQYENYDYYRNCGNYNYEISYYVPMIGIFLIHSIGCALSVVGILKKSKCLQLPWLFGQCLMIIVPVIVSLVFSLRSLYGTDFSIAVNWIIVQAYIWYCGYSFYKKSSKTTISNSFLPVYVPNILTTKFAS